MSCGIEMHADGSQREASNAQEFFTSPWSYRRHRAVHSGVKLAWCGYRGRTNSSWVKANPELECAHCLTAWKVSQGEPEDLATDKQIIYLVGTGICGLVGAAGKRIREPGGWTGSQTAIGEFERFDGPYFGSIQFVVFHGSYAAASVFTTRRDVWKPCVVRIFRHEGLSDVDQCLLDDAAQQAVTMAGELDTEHDVGT